MYIWLYECEVNKNTSKKPFLESCCVFLERSGNGSCLPFVKVEQKQWRIQDLPQMVGKGIEGGGKTGLAGWELGTINSNRGGGGLCKQSSRSERDFRSPLSIARAIWTEKIWLKTLKRELGSFPLVLTTIASEVTEVNKLNLPMIQYIKLLS